MLSSSRYQESEIVRVTLIVLFLTLLIIYVTYFNINYEKYFVTPEILPGSELSIATGDSYLTQLDAIPGDFTAYSPITDLGELPDSSVVSSNTGNGSSVSEISTVDFTEVADDVNISSQQETGTNSEPLLATGMIVLSGTTQYFGDIDAIDVMGLDYRYALSDGEIIYAYLGTGDYDFKPIARNLGGNVVEIVTEIDILKNDLFGQKINFVNIPGVTYVTMPVEERQMVFMVVWFGEDRRLTQVDFASYHRLKSTMKLSFASYYK